MLSLPAYKLCEVTVLPMVSEGCGMRFTYPGQHDWGNFSEGSVGLGIFRSSMIQDLRENHHQNMYIS